MIIIRVIKSRMRWVGHVAHIRTGEVHNVLVGKLKEQGHLEDPGIDGTVLLRLIFRKWDRVGHELD
jgi:hypothetical protein